MMLENKTAVIYGGWAIGSAGARVYLGTSNRLVARNEGVLI
jgi:hypothetical protein